MRFNISHRVLTVGTVNTLASLPLLQIVEETIPELVKLKEEGLIRHIGITGLPLPIYKKVLDRCTACFLFLNCVTFLTDTLFAFCYHHSKMPPLVIYRQVHDRLSPWILFLLCFSKAWIYTNAVSAQQVFILPFVAAFLVTCLHLCPQLMSRNNVNVCATDQLPLCRLPKGTVDVILAYCHNSLNDDSLQGLVPYLKEQDVGIISASPMSMGLMTTKVSFYYLNCYQ